MMLQKEVSANCMVTAQRCGCKVSKVEELTFTAESIQTMSD